MHTLMRFAVPMILICLCKIVNGQSRHTAIGYQFFVDLNKVKDDRLEIKLITPPSESDNLIYRIARIVPGTYSDDNFGRYISNFRAFTKQGQRLRVTRLTVNSFAIGHAKQLHSIKYLVDDTWDSPEIPGHFIFEPTGSNISKDSVFIINPYTFFGYFEGLKQLPYLLEFKKPKGFYGATSLKRIIGSNAGDHFSARDFQALADAPIMYAKPDTTFFSIGNTRVEVAVYSPHKKVRAADISTNIVASLEAQKAYLGGKLPVDHYTFLIVFDDKERSGHVGALEHSYSSLFYRKEGEPSELMPGIKSSATHEFFHIVTPLNIHAEQIGDFDFIRPRMSAHLWLYEGLTEYASGHMQLKYGLMTLPDYLLILEDKITAMKYRYSETLPITVMSAHVLDDYKNEYPNVYSKGALIWLCLDIKLRELSNGQYGTQELTADLARLYGKNRSFKDDELFSKITSFTYPEIGLFLETYVSGNKPLPIEQYLKKIGIRMEISGQIALVDGYQTLPAVKLKLDNDPGVSEMKLRGSWLSIR